MNLADRFRNFIQEKKLFSPGDRLLLAVSGGADSTVLCELCHQSGYNFVIAHCNFQLRGEASDQDEQFVKELAQHYKVPFLSKKFDTVTIASQQKTTIEETARNLRYEWFHDLLDPQKSSLPLDSLPKFIVTGHHADDNIETVLMNFFRGTGIKGLRGILPKRGKVVRPLLFALRKEIDDFTCAHSIDFRSDATNFDDAYTRNFFRNQVIPQVHKYFPAAEQNILHSIERMVEVEKLYDQAIALHKSKLLEIKGEEVHIPVLKLAKSEPLHTITYEIIKDYGFSSHQVEEVISLLDSESGKYVASPTHRIIRNRKWLIIAPANTEMAENILVEEKDAAVDFELGRLEFTYSPYSERFLKSENHTAALDADELQFPLLLRKWKTGDYFYPFGMKKKKKKVARFLIDLKLSKTQKESTWVIESNKRILWVVGYRIDERFRLTDKTRKVLSISILSRK